MDIEIRINERIHLAYLLRSLEDLVVLSTIFVNPIL